MTQLRRLVIPEGDDWIAERIEDRAALCWASVGEVYHPKLE